ncbi:MAG: ATP-binding protein [Streptosporangiaceae bacterium]
MDETISVEVGEDHLAAFRRSPKVAIAELIWNGLDADATEVSVEYELNSLDGVDAVTVRDDGTGMTPADAAFGFRNFGNSWKRTATATRGGRSVHGKLGCGRYTAYAIGAHPVWTSVADDSGVLRRLTVTGSASALRSVRVASEPDPVDDPAGTMVRIDQLTEQAQRELLHEGIWQELTTRFAPYLEQYPDVSITYRGNSLNAARLQGRTDTMPIVLDDAGVEATLTIIEWNIKVERRLYLCDENGSALADMPPGVQAPGHQFTAYLRWAGFRDIGHDILLAEMDSGAVGELVAAAKDRIRDYFKGRAAEKQQEQIREWEAEGAYPDFGDQTTPVRIAERQAFDIVALSAASVVNEGTPRSRRLALNLIKTALESGPTALQDVLLNVLELPQDKVEELRTLLNRTTLASVIEASKRIADRLDFLAGLDALIFDTDSKRQTLERRQLHRILANETWVFGEEWALTGDDDRLTRVLAEHLHLLGKDVDLASLPPVLREGGSDAIPDLVLSRTMETAENKYEHLIVELKRPSHKLTPADIDQIRSYAVAVAEDDRFQQPNVQWTYVLVGNSTSTGVDDQRAQVGQPYGRAQITTRYSIWVRNWAEVIGDAQHRHKFVQQSLDYKTTHDAGVDYLRRKHRQYLPDAMLPDSDPAEAGPG